MAISGQFLTTIQTTLLPVYFEKRILDNLTKNLQLYKLTGVKRQIPRGQGKTIWFNRPVHLAAQTTPLSESVTPSQVQLSSEGVSTQVAIYGAYTAMSELSRMSMIDIDWMADEFGYNAQLTVDTLIRNEYNASASGILTAATVSAGAVLTGDKVRRAVTRLRNSDVPGVFDGNEKYALVCHPNTLYDLMADTSAGGWQNIVKNSEMGANQDLAVRGVVRDVFGARVFESTNVLASADGSAGLASAGFTSSLVYRNMIFGRDAYGVVQIAGPGSGNVGNPQVIVKDLGSAGTEDPLNQRATIGWKLIFAALFLKTTSDDPRGHILFTGATGI